MFSGPLFNYSTKVKERNFHIDALKKKQSLSFKIPTYSKSILNKLYGSEWDKIIVFSKPHLQSYIKRTYKSINFKYSIIDGHLII